jgi:hypothetical protein
LWIGNSEPFPNSDPYGILTAIICNIIIALILWEICFRIKNATSANSRYPL